MALNLRKASEVRKEEREIEKMNNENNEIDQDALLLSSMGVSEDDLTDAILSGAIDDAADVTEQSVENEDISEDIETDGEDESAEDEFEEDSEVLDEGSDADEQSDGEKAASSKRSPKARKVIEEDAVSGSIRNRRANRKERDRLYNEGDFVVDARPPSPRLSVL